MTVISRLVAIGASAIAIFAFAGENLYRVNSKDVGYGSIDLTISEVKRDGRVSVLHIPHYETRSSVESRFAMCAFTDIAIQRGFEAWVVSNKRADDDLVRVGFLKSEADDVAKKYSAKNSWAGLLTLRRSTRSIECVALPEENDRCGAEAGVVNAR